MLRDALRSARIVIASVCGRPLGRVTIWPSSRPRSMREMYSREQAIGLASSSCDIPRFGRTEKLKNPHPSGSLAWFSWIVARLGGWSGYTSRGYKPAGPKTIARGLSRLDGFIGGWALHSADMQLP